MSTLIASSSVPRRRLVRAFVRYDAVGFAMAVCDILIILATAQMAGALYHGFVLDVQRDVLHYGAIGAVFSAFVVLLSQMRGVYEPTRIADAGGQLSSMLLIWFGVIAALTSCAFALKISASFSRGAVLLFAALVPPLLAANRFYWKRYIGRAMSAATFVARRIGVITDGSYFARHQLVGRLQASGFEIVRHVDLSLPSGGERLSLRKAVKQAAVDFRGARIDEIVVAMAWRRFPLASRIAEGLRTLPLPVRLVMDPQTTEMATQQTRRIGGLLAVELQRGRMSSTEHAIKRAMDVTLACIALFLLSPLLLVVALAIKLDTPGPALFRQTRHGFNGLPFRILKFRSMSVMEDGAVVQQARRVDLRVTRVGKWIRRTSVDELPQLWNVIQGEMSLVGPRPHAAAHDGYYEALLGDYAFRQHVKPGITGWAQVNGSRGETATIESMAHRVQLDVWYVNHRSALLDLKIMLMTVAQLFRNRQVY